MAGRPPVYKTCPLCLRKMTAREMQAHKCPRKSDAEAIAKRDLSGDSVRLREPVNVPLGDA